MQVGDKVRSKANTLAYFAGDVNGVIEKLDGGSILVRMKQSGRLVPFRPDQLVADGWNSQYSVDSNYD